MRCQDMWNKSIGLIIFLKIAFIVTNEDDEITDSRTFNSNWLIDKEYALIFIEASWYKATEYCMEHEMLLASFNSLEEQQHLDMIIKDRYLDDEQFWISKAVSAREGGFQWTMSKNTPFISKSKPSNQCIYWHWMNVELCIVLRPLTNEWNYDICDQKKYFICERISRKEGSTPIWEKLEEELSKLVDKMMLLDFAEAAETTTEDEWVGFVKGGLYTWVQEQQQILKPMSLIREEAILLAEEVAEMTTTLESDELRMFVKNKFDMLKPEEKLSLLNERFRNLISDEAVKLKEKATSAAKQSGESLFDEMVSLLVGKVIMLAREVLSKSAEKPSDTLDEDLMKGIALDLVKFSEEEYKIYLLEVVSQFKQWGVKGFDMNTLFQLFLLVRQELFALIMKTAIKATLEERLDIAGYGLSKILEGDIQLTEQKSVFGKVFVSLAAELVILADEEFLNLDDEHLRTFVRKEFEGLNYEDKLKLNNDGYIKFMIDEFVKLASDPNVAKNEFGQLLLENINSLLASKLFWFADDEMKLIAERLSKLRLQESNRHVLVFQIMAQSTKWRVHKYEEEKLFKLFLSVEQELFMFISQSLGNLTEGEIIALAEQGLSKLLAVDTFKSIDDKSIFGKVLISLAVELSKLTEEEFANLKDDGLYKLVKSKLQMVKYEEGIELFEEAVLKSMADEFIKFTKEGTATLAAEKGTNHQYGEMVKLLAAKLLKIAGK